MSILQYIKVLTLGVFMTFTKVNSQDLPNSQYFDSNGVKIHYIEQGTGEAVLLLHWNTGSVNGWLEQGGFQNLAKDHRVIAFDARGHGKSDKPHDASAYGSEMSQDIVRLLDHLGVRKAHMVGYSMGTRTMSHLISSHPERFLTATFGGFIPKWNWTAKDQEKVEKKSKEFLNNPKQRLLDEGQDIQAHSARVLSSSELVVTKEDLSNFQMPTLAINTKRSEKRLIEFKKIMPELKVVLIDGTTHESLIWHPDFIKTVRAFLAEHKSD